ncbi:MAG: hypothetical protein ACUVWN_15115 [bacterium]
MKKNYIKLKQILKLQKSDIVAYMCLAFITGIYAYVQIIHFTPAYQEVDPDGYLILAKRIAEGGSIAVKDDDPFMYQSHVWVENSKGEIAPKFAPGYPFLMSIAYLLGGDIAMFFVSPIMGGLSLIGSYMLFRLWMSRVSALFGVFYLATNAMILVYSGYLLTHASDMCFAVWGMYFLWRWKRENINDTKHYTFISIFAGLLLGGAMTIRHTSALLFLTLISTVIVKWLGFIKLKKYPIRETIIILASYAIFPLILLIYNWVIFGSPFTSGYALSGEQNAFKLKNILTNLHILTLGLNYTGLFFMFPIGFAGIFLALPICETIMALSWIIPQYLLYSSYYWAPDGMSYFRFLIVIFPALVGLASAILDKNSKSWLRKAIIYIILSGFIIFIRYNDTESALRNTVSDFPSRSLAYSAQRASKILNDDAVIFSRRPIFCYLGTRKHFRMYDLYIFTASYGASAFPENVEPRRQPLRNNRLREFYKGLSDDDLKNKKLELIRNFIKNGRQVVFLLPNNAVSDEQNALGSEFKWKALDSWDITATIVNGAWQGETWTLYEIRRDVKN